MKKVNPPPKSLIDTQNDDNKIRNAKHVEAQKALLVASDSSVVLSFDVDKSSGIDQMQRLQIALSIPAANQLAHSIEKVVGEYLNSDPDSE